MPTLTHAPTKSLPKAGWFKPEGWDAVYQLYYAVYGSILSSTNFLKVETTKQIRTLHTSRIDVLNTFHDGNGKMYMSNSKSIWQNSHKRAHSIFPTNRIQPLESSRTCSMFFQVGALESLGINFIADLGYTLWFGCRWWLHMALSLQWLSVIFESCWETLLFQLHVLPCIFFIFWQVKTIKSAWGWSGLGSWQPWGHWPLLRWCFGAAKHTRKVAILQATKQHVEVSSTRKARDVSKDTVFDLKKMLMPIRTMGSRLNRSVFDTCNVRICSFKML